MVCMYIYMNMCMYRRIYVFFCLYICCFYLCVCMYVICIMYVYMFVRLFACYMYVHTYECICVYVYICVCMNI